MTEEHFMTKEKRALAFSKVGTKGQIVIPKHIRDMFDVKPGDTVLIMADATRGIAIVNNDDYMKFAHDLFEGQKEPK